MSAPLASYDQLAGKRLAIIEHMLTHPSLLGLRQARETGLHLTLLVGTRGRSPHGQP